MKLHGSRRCGLRFQTYVGLEEHLLSHRNVCVTCKRSFAKPSILQGHTCKVTEYLCESCQRPFSTRKQLDRHQRETQCHFSLPLEPRRRKTTSRTEEDPIQPPPSPSTQDTELQKVLIENWASIRTHVARGPVQLRYNFRLTCLDTRAMELRQILEEQTNAFKVNVSFGFVLQHKQSQRYKYYHSSCNCCGMYLDEPSLVTNEDTFEAFLERIHQQDVLKWAINQRPDSDWICHILTNMTFFVNRILQHHPIGCVGRAMPNRVKRNKCIIGLAKKRRGQTVC